jgi:hypothetical protein
VQICGTAVQRGDVEVKKSGTDILIGDPLTAGCPGNSVERGSVEVKENFTDVELVIRGNSIPRGNLEVIGNTGPSDKFVQSNTGGRKLRCIGNTPRFFGSPNPGWQRYEGQCSA